MLNGRLWRDTVFPCEVKSRIYTELVRLNLQLSESLGREVAPRSTG